MSSVSKKEHRMIEKRWEDTFANADACMELYNQGMNVSDIALVMKKNTTSVENYLRLAKAFPDNRIKNVPIDVYWWASKYPDPMKALVKAWNSNWKGDDLQYYFQKSHCETFPVPVSERERQTPIEVALGVDEEGMTTARKLYEFLELHPANYARWVKKNIIENIFAEPGIDYFPFIIDDEREKSGFGNPHPTKDYKLTATFAKKLAMASQTPKGEEAREYFVRVEQNAKDFANGKLHCMTPQGGAFSPKETADLILDVADRFKDHLPQECIKKMAMTVIELRGGRCLA